MTESDRSHLKILSIFYYVLGGLSLVATVLLGGIYGVLGIVMLANPDTFTDSQTNPEEIKFAGAVLLGVAVFVAVLGLLSTILQFLTAGGLRKQKRYVLCFVVAILACLNVPLGTILGIFTIVVLVRPSVKAEFEAVRAARA